MQNTEHIACTRKVSAKSWSRTDWEQPHCKAASCSRTTNRVESGTPRRQTHLSGLQSPPPGTHGPAHEKGGSGLGTGLTPRCSLTAHRTGQSRKQRQQAPPEHFGDLKDARAQLLTCSGTRRLSIQDLRRSRAKRLQALTARWLGLKLNFGLSSSSSAAKTVTVRRAGAAHHCLHCTDCPASCRLPITGVESCMHSGCSTEHSSPLTW